MLDPISLTTITAIAKNFSIISLVIGILFGLFRGYTWVKNKFINIDSNIVEVKKSLDTHIQGLRDDIKTQTTTLANALGEQRADFRTFYMPTLLLQQQAQQFQQIAPIMAKKPVKKVKKKVPRA